MTPEAYIDDGMLDVCVITEGKPLSTMQQLSSLIATHNMSFARRCHRVLKLENGVAEEVKPEALAD